MCHVYMSPDRRCSSPDDPVKTTYEPAIDERLDPVLDELETFGLSEPVAETAGSRCALVMLLESRWNDRAKANLRIQAGGEPFEVARGEPFHE